MSIGSSYLHSGNSYHIDIFILNLYFRWTSIDPALIYIYWCTLPVLSFCGLHHTSLCHNRTYTTICHILYCHKCVMVYTCHGCNDITNWKYILHMARDYFNHLFHILVINRTEGTTRNAAVTSVSDKWITLWWYHYCPLYFYFIITLTWFDITTHPSRLEPESPFCFHTGPVWMSWCVWNAPV